MPLRVLLLHEYLLRRRSRKLARGLTAVRPTLVHLLRSDGRYPGIAVPIDLALVLFLEEARRMPLAEAAADTKRVEILRVAASDELEANDLARAGAPCSS